jgi:hypothetical protein
VAEAIGRCLHTESRKWEREIESVRNESQREIAALNCQVAELRVELRKALADTHKVSDLPSLRKVN